MKIYISGKMSGLPMQEVRRKFRAAEEMLQSMNSFEEIVNPCNNGLTEKHTWQEHMTRDIGMLLQCNAIFMMDDWLDSVGAGIEYDIANRVGMEVFFGTREIEVNKVVMRIQGAIHEATGMHPKQYLNKSRKRDKVFARMIFVHHCRKNKMRLVQIGKYIKRDHSSVSHLLIKYNDDYTYNSMFRRVASKVNTILEKAR